MTGAELKQRALAFCNNQAEIARRLGIPPQNLESNWRSKEPSLLFAIRLSDALEVPLYKLLGITYREGKNVQDNTLLIKHKADQVEVLAKEIKGLLKG